MTRTRTSTTRKQYVQEKSERGTAGREYGVLRPSRKQTVVEKTVREYDSICVFNDPRFAPLVAPELAVTTVEVSLLSPASRVEVADEEDLLARLEPGVDGIVLELGRRRATFLPQVWESLPDPRDFIGALKRKAGMPASFWSPEMRVSRYTVARWQQAEFASELESVEAKR